MLIFGNNYLRMQLNMFGLAQAWFKMCFNSWLICARPVNSDMYCPWQKVYDIGNWNAMTDAIGHCKFLHSRNPHWEYQYFANDD